MPSSAVIPVPAVATQPHPFSDRLPGLNDSWGCDRQRHPLQCRRAITRMPSPSRQRVLHVRARVRGRTGLELAVDQAHHFNPPVIEVHGRLTIQHLSQGLLTGRLRAQSHGRDVLRQLVVGQHPDLKAGR